MGYPVREGPYISCPYCRARGRTGRAMIGNRIGECKACGAFARRAPKRLIALFAEKYPDLYLEFRTQAEYEVYSEIVEEFRETMAKEGILV